eukprot:COSAG02_NODE_23380_length_720_cov_1.446055_1_plen_123_part_10
MPSRNRRASDAVRQRNQEHSATLRARQLQREAEAEEIQVEGELSRTRAELASIIRMTSREANYADADEGAFILSPEVALAMSGKWVAKGRTHENHRERETFTLYVLPCGSVRGFPTDIDPDGT